MIGNRYMNKIKSSWTKEQFKAYLMVYAAQSDQVETEEEKDHLESHFDELLLKEIRKEINKDNDFSRIQKIMSHIKENNYLENDLNAILESIKKMYMVDGSFGAAEQMVYTSLQKLFKIN